METCTSNGDFIESAELKLEYAGVLDGAAVFNLYDKSTGEVSPVGFGLRYWRSFQEDYQQRSGAYIFRSVTDQYDSYIYASVAKV